MIFLISANRITATALVRVMRDTFPDYSFSFFPSVHEAREAMHTGPKAVITDLIVGEHTAYALLRYADRHDMDVHFLVLTSSQLGMEYLLEHENVSILHQTSDVDTLAEAMTRVLNGKRFVDPEVAVCICGGTRERHRHTLTPREVEVLSCYLQGMTPEDIAKRIYLSPKTVRVHKANIMHKIGARSEIDLLHFGLRAGLIPGSVGTTVP